MRTMKHYNPATDKLQDDATYSTIAVVCSPTDEQLRDARSVIEADYQADVDGIALDIYRRRAEWTDLSDEIHTCVDGSARVIYTYQARLGVLATDNQDAWQDMGLENPTVEQQMYAAMIQDVAEELERNYQPLIDAEEEQAA